MIRPPLALVSASALALWAAPAAAQDRISVDVFLDMLTGRTATFSSFGTGRIVGVEEFVSRSETRWARANGTCAVGTVFEKGGLVCFVYDDDPPGREHCWATFLDAGQLMVMAWPSGGIQVVTEITGDGVSCTPPPTS